MAAKKVVKFTKTKRSEGPIQLVGMGSRKLINKKLVMRDPIGLVALLDGRIVGDSHNGWTDWTEHPERYLVEGPKPSRRGRLHFRNAEDGNKGASYDGRVLLIKELSHDAFETILHVKVNEGRILENIRCKALFNNHFSGTGGYHPSIGMYSMEFARELDDGRIKLLAEGTGIDSNQLETLGQPKISKDVLHKLGVECGIDKDGARLLHKLYEGRKSVFNETELYLLRKLLARGGGNKPEWDTNFLFGEEDSDENNTTQTVKAGKDFPTFTLFSNCLEYGARFDTLQKFLERAHGYQVAYEEKRVDSEEAVHRDILLKLINKYQDRLEVYRERMGEMSVSRGLYSGELFAAPEMLEGRVEEAAAVPVAEQKSGLEEHVANPPALSETEQHTSEEAAAVFSGVSEELKEKVLEVVATGQPTASAKDTPGVGGESPISYPVSGKKRFQSGNLLYKMWDGLKRDRKRRVEAQAVSGGRRLEETSKVASDVRANFYGVAVGALWEGAAKIEDGLGIVYNFGKFVGKGGSAVAKGAVKGAFKGGSAVAKGAFKGGSAVAKGAAKGAVGFYNFVTAINNRAVRPTGGLKTAATGGVARGAVRPTGGPKTVATGSTIKSRAVKATGGFWSALSKPPRWAYNKGMSAARAVGSLEADTFAAAFVATTLTSLAALGLYLAATIPKTVYEGKIDGYDVTHKQGSNKSVLILRDRAKDIERRFENSNLRDNISQISGIFPDISRAELERAILREGNSKYSGKRR